MNKIFIFLNGLADDALKDLNGRKPLEVANTPTLDKIAADTTFIVNPPCCGGVETAMLSFLSGTKVTVPIPQAPLKALASEIHLNSRQVAFSIQFVALGNDSITNVDYDIINDEEGVEFCRYLNDNFNTKGCYFLYLQKSCGLAVLDIDMIDVNKSMIMHEGSPIKLLNQTWIDSKNNQLNVFLKDIRSALEAHEINAMRVDLEEDVVNGVLFSQGGVLPEGFLNKENSLSKTMLYTDSISSIGAAKLAGVRSELMELKNYDKDIAEFVDNIDCKSLNCNTLVWENNLLWDSTYRGNLLEKIKRIEYLDKVMLAPLYDYCFNNDIDLIVLPLKNSSIIKGSWEGGAVYAYSYSITNIYDKKMDLHELI